MSEISPALTVAMTIPLADFEIPLQIVILGFVTGLSYALLGLGLTLVYRTTRTLNFAHGEMGALPAVLVPVLVANRGWGYWSALGVAVALAVVIGAVVERAVIRPLRNASRLVVLVATIGVAQVLFVVNALIPKVGALASAVYPTPFAVSVTVGHLRLNSGHLMILALVPVITVALVWFLQRTRAGLGARALAENLDAAELAGVPAGRISLLVWVVAALLACGSAILLGPTRPVLTQEAIGPSLMVRALAAAMIGGLTNMPRVFVGGVAIGVVEALVAWNYPTGGMLEVVVFLVIIGSLLAQKGLGQAARNAVQSSWSLAGSVRSLPADAARLPVVRRARLVGAFVALAVAAVWPALLSSAQQTLAASVVVFAIAALSLVVLTGFTGQVSLGQFAFVALGAIIGGRMHQLGYPQWVGVSYAVVGAGAAALVVGLPALRIRGLFLAVATLGFAVASGTWLFQQPWLVNTEGAQSSLAIPRSAFLGVDLQHTRNYYWLCLTALLVVMYLVDRIRRSGLGRAMMAVRDNEPAAATLGVSPGRIKLVAFVLSGMIAGFAGWLYGGLLVNFSAFPLIFPPQRSVALVALAIFGGVTTVTGAVLGAVWVQGIPYFFGDNIGLLSSGLGLLVVLLVIPGGLAGGAFRLRDLALTRLLGRPVDTLRPNADQVGVAKPSLPARPAERHAGTALPLRAEGITVRFGGNLAVDDVSIEAGHGEIVGLMGPNGAGKTTLFDVLSGQSRATSGRVLLHGVDVSGLGPEQRARRGMGRTFQQARLFDDLPLLDAIKVALECVETSETVPCLLGLPPARRAERIKHERAEEVLGLLGLEPFARRRVSELSTGTRRIAELGTMVAMGSDVVLLDEPTAGVAQREVEAFRPVLREIRDHLGATMVVIEHDIPLMMGLVDRLYVLNAGRVIAEGPPAVLREDPAVVAAYLGTDERVISRSGSAAADGGMRRRRPPRAHQEVAK